MKNKKIVIGIIIIVCIAVGVSIIFMNKNSDDTENRNNFVNDYSNVNKENEISYQNDVSVGELKNETGLTGDDSIYQIDTEFDGRKVLNIKADIQYKVALAGVLQKDMPNYNDVDNVIQEALLTKNGIWVEESSREKFMNLLKTITESEYEISSDGFLNIINKENQNEYDKKIEKIINGEAQYIMQIADKYYELDTVTGEVVEYPYQRLDPYQTYDVVEDSNNRIYFLNTNSDNKISDEDIIKDVINTF